MVDAVTEKCVVLLAEPLVLQLLENLFEGLGIIGLLPCQEIAPPEFRSLGTRKIQITQDGHTDNDLLALVEMDALAGIILVKVEQHMRRVRPAVNARLETVQLEPVLQLLRQSYELIDGGLVGYLKDSLPDGLAVLRRIIARHFLDRLKDSMITLLIGVTLPILRLLLQIVLTGSELYYIIKHRTYTFAIK